MQCVKCLAAGHQGRFAKIDGDPSFRRRIMEMGFTPGTSVRVVRSVPIGGLVELEVRRCRVTLRHAEAERIFVEAG